MNNLNTISPDAKEMPSENINDNKIPKTWIMSLISCFRVHFTSNYLKPSRVFPELSQRQLVIQKIIQNGFSKQTKFHIKYLLILELVNSVSQPKKPLSGSFESCESLGPCRLAIVNTKPSASEKNTTQNHKSRKETRTYSIKLSSQSKTSRKKSNIYHLRNLNNWIKNMLICEYIDKLTLNHKSGGNSLRVLDMCCGKGGDLLKYSNQSISHVICTDIAEASLKQCKTRYDRLPKRKHQSSFSAEFFACDCSRDRLRVHYKSPWLEHHLVSCQFALHYGFESYQQADCMISNASECLQPGGFFIATIPNANEIMRRLRKSNDGRSFGNEFYSVQFLCETQKPPIFGARYLFQLEGVVDSLEFLVHFPTLVKLCRKHGLQLDKVNTFAEYFEASYHRGENLLRKTEGLQTVYFEGDSKIEEDFKHIENFVNETQCWANDYGTLSKPEWDVATLYLVCAFSKCDNTWDDEFKPIYSFDS